MDWERDQRILNDLLVRGIIRAPSSEVQAAFEDWKAQEAAKEIDSWDACHIFGDMTGYAACLKDDARRIKWASSNYYDSANLAYLAADTRRKEMIEAVLRRPRKQSPVFAAIPSSPSRVKLSHFWEISREGATPELCGKQDCLVCKPFREQQE